MDSVTDVSHTPRPQVSDEIAPYFFWYQSQRLVYALRLQRLKIHGN